MAVDLFDEAYDALTPAAKVKYLARTMAAAANNDARTDGPFASQKATGLQQQAGAEDQLNLELKDSTCVSGGWYNEDESALYVQFQSGSLYRYSDVDPLDAFRWKESASLGKYFVANIRLAYAYQRIS